MRRYKLRPTRVKKPGICDLCSHERTTTVCRVRVTLPVFGVKHNIYPGDVSFVFLKNQLEFELCKDCFFLLVDQLKQRTELDKQVDKILADRVHAEQKATPAPSARPDPNSQLAATRRLLGLLRDPVNQRIEAIDVIESLTGLDFDEAKKLFDGGSAQKASAPTRIAVNGSK